MFAFLRYIFGFVRFTATGGFTERFINLAAGKRIPIWNSKNTSSGFIGDTTISGYREMAEIAKKSGVKLHMLGKHGLPFFYKKIHLRAGLFIGAAIFSIMLTFYSRSIWRIDVSGNSSISTESVLRSAEKSGLYIGAFKGKIKPSVLRKRITDENPSVAWVNVNIDGSFARIEVLEGNVKPRIKGEQVPMNVVAAEDGIIVDMKVYEGEKCVNKGDSVCKGDLLVSGTLYYENTDATVLHTAMAKVFAQVKKDKKIYVKKRAKKTVYTGKTRRKDILYFWGMKIPLFIFSEPQGEWERTEIKRDFSLFGVKIPVSVSKVLYRQTKTVEYNATLAQARSMARNEAEKFEKSFPEGTKILSRKVKVSGEVDTYIFYYSYLVNENIAKSVRINIGR